MKSYQILLTFIIIFFCICGSPVFAQNITDCDLINNNIYGPSFYNISTPGTFDQTTTESDTTNIAGRYVYAVTLSSSIGAGGGRADYTVSTIQGATVIGGSGNPVLPGWYWEYGDTTTARTNDLYHIYTSPGTYITNLTLSNAADTTGITLNTSTTLTAPIINSVAIPPYNVKDYPVTFSSMISGATAYQWQYSTNNISWSNFAGATSGSFFWTSTDLGTYYIRIAASNADFTVYSTPQTITVHPLPSAAVSVSPTSGPIASTLTLSSTVVNTIPIPLSYQWQRSSDATTWTNIGGATTEDYTGYVSFAAAGTNYLRQLVSAGPYPGVSNVVTYEATAAPVITSATASPTTGEIPLTVSLSATATGATSFKWQKLIGVIWTDIGTSQTVSYQITTANVHQFRVIATGIGGSTTSSVVSVNAGGRPVISITSPDYNEIYAVNESIVVSASIVGADTISWSFGDAGAEGDTTANPTTVIYRTFGKKTITLTASNAFGTSTDSVTISIGGTNTRPFATATLTAIPTSSLENLTDIFDVPPGEVPDVTELFFAIAEPYENAVGVFFMLIIFGTIFIMLWLITKNVIVPCIIGIVFGTFVLAFLPDGYYGPAIAIMALSITGAIIKVFMPPRP